MATSLGQIYARLTLDLRNFNDNLSKAKRSVAEFETEFKNVTKKMGQAIGTIFATLKKGGKSFRNEFKNAAQSARGDIGKLSTTMDNFAERAGKKIAGMLGTFNKKSKEWAQGLEAQAKRMTQAVDRLVAHTNKFGVSGERATKKFTQGLKETNRTAKQTQTLLDKISHALTVSFTFAAAAQLRRGLSQLTQSSIEFEKSMSTVRAVLGERLGATVQEQTQNFKRLEDAARNVGRTTVFTAAEAAGGLEQLTRAGYGLDDAIAALAPTTNLAIAGQIGMAEAARTVVNTLNQYGMSSLEAVDVTDKLAWMSTHSKTNIQDLGTALRYAGTEAATFKVPFNETVAIIGALSDAGIEASRAGAAFRRILVGLHRPSEKQRKILKSLGLSFHDIAVTTTGSVTKSFDLLREKGMNATQMLEFFQIRGVAAGAQIYKASGKVNEFAMALDNVSGEAKRQADVMRDNLWGAAKELWSAFEDLGISLSKVVFPALTQFLKHLTSAVRWIADVAKSVSDFASRIPGLATLLEVLLGLLTSILALRVAAKFLSWGSSLTKLATGFDLVTKSARAASGALAMENVISSMNSWGRFGGVIGKVGLALRQFGLNAANSSTLLGGLTRILPSGTVAIAGLTATVASVAAAFVVWAKNIADVIGWLKKLGGGSIISGVQNVWGKFKANLLAEAKKGNVGLAATAKAGFTSIEDAYAETTQQKFAQQTGAERSKNWARMAKIMNAQTKFKGKDRYQALSEADQDMLKSWIQDPNVQKDYAGWRKKLLTYAGGEPAAGPPEAPPGDEDSESQRLAAARKLGQEKRKQLQLEQAARSDALSLQEMADKLAVEQLRTGKENVDQVVLKSAMEDEAFKREQDRFAIKQENLAADIAGEKELQAYYEQAGLKKEALETQRRIKRLEFQGKTLEYEKALAESANRVRQEEEKTNETLRQRELQLKRINDLYQFEKDMGDLDYSLAKEEAIQKGATEEELYELEYNHKKDMLKIDMDRNQLEIARIENLKKEAGDNAKLVDQYNLQLDQLQNQNILLQRQGQLLEAQRKTFMERDMREMANAWAGAWTGAFGDILNQIEEGQFKLEETVTQLGKNIIDSAVKPLLEDIQEELNKTFISIFQGMSSTMRNIFTGLVGGAILGIGSFLKGQKEDVESLADDASQEIIDNTEKVRGLVAGETQIGIAKLSENLGAALRPTNEILLRIEKLLGGKGPTATPQTMTVTRGEQNGGFAMDVIGASRV